MYGIFISLAILSAVLITRHLLTRPTDKELVWDLALVALFCGILGARLYHVIDFHKYYGQDPIKIVYLWQGGLGIWGAIFGGLAGVWAYLRYKKQNIVYWLDIIAVVMPLAQAIGRLGNYFNQELFGLPTKLVWAIYIEPLNRPAEYRQFSRFHPLFAYEAILNLILFYLLFLRYTKKKVVINKGFYFFAYLSGYAVIRFGLEFLRINPWKIYGLNVAQAISILIVSICSVFFLAQLAKNKK